MVENTGSDLIPSFAEEAIDHAEAIWDTVASSELAEAIPVVKHFVKGWRAIDDLRSRMLAAKLRSFILEPSLQTPEAKEKMRERAGSDEAKRVGESLFMVLERLTDRLKPIWLAKLFAGYLSNDLSASDLRRLASALDAAFGDDLVTLIGAPDEAVQANSYEPWKRYLVQSGLVELQTLGAIGGPTQTYSVTDLGRLFRTTVRKHS